MGYEDTCDKWAEWDATCKQNKKSVKTTMR